MGGDPAKVDPRFGDDGDGDIWDGLGHGIVYPRGGRLVCAYYSLAWMAGRETGLDLLLCFVALSSAITQHDAMMMMGMCWLWRGRYSPL